MTLPEKWIIRTSDRMFFKRCRQQWHFSSKLRMNMEPNSAAKPLEFGTSIHYGLEGYYDPILWGHPELQLVSAISNFKEKNAEQLAIVKGQGNPDDEVLADYRERLELGVGMLESYALWAPEHDKALGLKPLYTELEFEVPILVPENFSMDGLALTGRQVVLHKAGFSWTNDKRQLYYLGVPVVYQGKIDLVAEHEDGYWIWDHKTAAQFKEDMSYLDMDEQCGSYAWALQHMLNIPIRGVLYNQLYKGIPKPPERLSRQYKGRWFSSNKQQDTTYELYLRTITDAGEDIELYEDILYHLKHFAGAYFRRIPVHRTPTELRLLGERIFLEAIDMLNDPSIYPAPDMFKCNGCWWKVPCLATQEGSDASFILDINYHKRKKETV